MNVSQIGFVKNINHQIDQAQMMFGRLPKRDQLALSILAAFLTVFIIGGGGYWLHHKAETAQANADQQRQLLLWMRGQAPHLQASSGPAQPLSTIVQEAAAQQGLTVTQSGTEGRLMVTVSHQSFAVLGTWLTRLAQSGIQIDQLDIEQQVGGILQLQATLTKP
ncbi:MAG: type II secretion system protein GspM [Aquirhabdus sp.]